MTQFPIAERTLLILYFSRRSFRRSLWAFSRSSTASKKASKFSVLDLPSTCLFLSSSQVSMISGALERTISIELKVWKNNNLPY